MHDESFSLRIYTFIGLLCLYWNTCVAASLPISKLCSLTTLISL